MKFSLDILIPTYNRREHLLKNLNLLDGIITDLKINDYVKIIVSDNASSDGTEVAIIDYCAAHPSTVVKYTKQVENIGMFKNFLYCLEVSDADYVMLMGDDDYCSKEYVKEVINAIENLGVGCVLPSFKAIDVQGVAIQGGRDLNAKRRLYRAGVDNFLINNFRAHQMSGIVVKREGLYEECITRGLSNLYVQIYWVADRCLKYDTLHLPDYPILVTQTTNKAWSYDCIGLIGEIYENYKKLSIPEKFRYKAERRIVTIQSSRVLCLTNPVKQLKIFLAIMTHKNTSSYGRIMLPFVIAPIWIREFFLLLKYKLSKSK